MTQLHDIRDNTNWYRNVILLTSAITIKLKGKAMNKQNYLYKFKWQNISLYLTFIYGFSSRMEMASAIFKSIGLEN